ncbi:hypothetical protein CHARACLAT_032983 [Characodon lateralis]|uniref:Uncharacterized protein n=1 Tax=Characodon lateralis TaxID=208331 RepID=A0ABU7F809_9TELE|nr:hypothetical protein [Characodon lateralis]
MFPDSWSPSRSRSETNTELKPIKAPKFPVKSQTSTDSGYELHRTGNEELSVICFLKIFKVGCTVEQWVAVLHCNMTVVGSNPGLGSFSMDFPCSPRASLGSPWVLRIPSTVLTHDS